MVKNLLAEAQATGDASSIPGWGRTLEEKVATHSNILAWKIPWTRRAWQATVYGVAKNRTRLSTQHNHKDRGN